MDHLELPSNPQKVALEIPLLCKGKTSNSTVETFADFPKQNGWSIQSEKAKRNDEKVELDQEFATFIQSWLYFELLSVVTGQTIDIDSFQQSGNASILDSSPLKVLISRWEKSVISDSRCDNEGDLKSWYEKRSACLSVPGRKGHDSNKLSNKDDQKLVESVFFGITVLVETLYQAMEVICVHKRKGFKKPGTDTFWERSYTCRFYEDYDRARPLLELMESNGWCERELFCLDGGPRNLPITSLWFYAHMKPPRKGRNHQDCSRGGCQYDSNIDEDKYEVMHMEDGCNCQLIGPTFQALRDIVEAGDFPVVSVTPSGECKVERGSRVSEYVAISHVWSDGHGNPSDNALPSCFLKPLSRLISQALGTGEFPLDVRSFSKFPQMVYRNLRPYKKPDWFWIDTLCIPRQPVKFRSKAIQGMREPYAKAEVVLIFDNQLTHVNTRDMSDTEMLARLKMSNWSRRLWTFHEDTVGQYHYVQFRDRSVDIRRQGIKLTSSLKHIRDKHVHGEMQVAELGSAFSSVLNSFESRADIEASFSKQMRFGLETRGQHDHALMWYRSVLKTKSTTRESDQALCLASMMNLDMQKIAHAKDEERMKVLWSMVERLPIGILFSKSLKKLNFEGYRWAPASFLEFKNAWKVVDEWMGPESLHRKTIPRTVGYPGQNADLPVLYLQTVEEGSSDSGLSQESMEVLLRHITGKGHKARFFDVNGIGWNVEFQLDWHREMQCLNHADGIAIVLGAATISARTSYQGLLISYKQCDDFIQARAHRHVKVKRIATSFQSLMTGFEVCTKEMRSRYTAEFLVQFLWDSERSDEPEKVEEAEEALKQLLVQQEGLVEEDSKYWQEYNKTSTEYTGKRAKETERVDTVVMSSLFWPRVQAKLSEKKVWVCID